MAKRPYKHPRLEDGRKAYNPQRTEADINEEWHQLERMVQAWGVEPMASFFYAREIWRQDEVAGERWKEWQQRVWYPRNAARQQSSSEFTKEELEWLVDHFDGANDPMAQDIFNKVKQQLQK